MTRLYCSHSVSICLLSSHMADPIKYITRFQASEMLGLSTRTIDRYIRKKGIKIRKEGKNILLLESDILPLSRDIPVEHEVVGQEDYANAEHTATTEQKLVFSPSQEVLIKQFLQQTREELSRKDEKIESLQYKIGQLEARVEQSVPLLEAQNERHEAAQKTEQIEKLSLQIKRTNLVKNLYLLLFLLLALTIPVVFLMLQH